MVQQSARVLGQDHYLTATEMNFLLKSHGLLEGGPGKWGVTERGNEYAQEEHVQRGTGGYPRFNPSWDMRTWDSSVLDVLDLSADQKQQARDAARAARQAAAALRSAQVAASDLDSSDSDTTDESEIDLRPVVAIVAVAVLTFIAVRSAPHVRALWVERGAPGLKRLRERQGRQATAGSEPSADDVPAP